MSSTFPYNQNNGNTYGNIKTILSYYTLSDKYLLDKDIFKDINTSAQFISTEITNVIKLFTPELYDQLYINIKSSIDGVDT